jgi:secondary thiamine-phosphate synthase enzyme
MRFFQKNFKLPPFSKGFYLITDAVKENLPQISFVKSGFCHLFLLHTSASLCLNENYDPSVRNDFLNFTDSLIPQTTFFTHTLEGSDDMPAHIKSSLYGNSLLIPVNNGNLVLGVWQGIYLCEHKETLHRREIFATIFGEEI